MKQQNRYRGKFSGRMTAEQSASLAAETAIQTSFVQWCMLSLADNVLWFSIPNENDGSASFGKRLNEMGRRAGAADFFIGYQGTGYFIEFKSKTGPQRVAQITFENLCQSSGFEYAIARSSEQAIALVNAWGIPHRDISVRKKSEGTNQK